MTEQFFKINFLFDKDQVQEKISVHINNNYAADYICVCDGVIMNNVHTNKVYREIINGGIFSICDSGFIPLYLKWLYGIKREQYAGSSIFKDIIELRKYRMCFLGTNQNTLDGLQNNLIQIDSRISDMLFWELPFCKVEDFNYKEIARRIEETHSEIIWIALGAPKQEIFMSKLKPYLTRGVMIAVGAAFKFYSGGADVKRAPKWMIKYHMEFIHRIMMEPKKQIGRCWNIIKYLPIMLYQEKYKKNKI